MTPIFKRIFKQEIRTAIILILIVACRLIGQQARLNEYVRHVYDIVSDVTDENVFKNEAAAADALLPLTTDVNYLSYHYGAEAQNKYGIYVPNIIASISSEATSSKDYAFGMSFALAAACAACVFAGERRKKGHSFVNALPYKRSRLFLEKAGCGLIIISLYYLAEYIMLSLWIRRYIPQVNYLVQRLYLDEGYKLQIGELTHISGNFFVYAAAAILFYAAILFAQTVMGRTSTAGIMSVGLIIGGFLALHGAVDFAYEHDLDALTNTAVKFVDALEKISEQTPVFTALLLGIALIFMIAAYFSDKNVRLERSGDVFMFKPAKYIILLLFMAEGAFAFYFFMNSACDITIHSLAAGLGVLAAGAAFTLLLLNKLILKEAD